MNIHARAVLLITLIINVAASAHLSLEQTIQWKNRLVITRDTPGNEYQKIIRIIEQVRFEQAFHRLPVWHAASETIGIHSHTMMGRDARAAYRTIHSIQKIDEYKVRYLEPFLAKFKAHTVGNFEPRLVLRFEECDYELLLPTIKYQDQIVSESNGLTHGLVSQYQNISLAFYAYIINDLIKKNGFECIKPTPDVKLWGHRLDNDHPLNDNNFMVVRAVNPNLPGSPEEAQHRFELFKQEQPIRFAQMLKELAQLKNQAYLWDFNLKTIIFLKEGDLWFAQPIGYEKPGVGGGYDENFFQNNEHENLTCVRRDGDREFKIFFGLSDEDMEEYLFPEML